MSSPFAVCSAASVLDVDVTYDVVITNVRAIDPESGLDAIRDIGILGRRISSVSGERLHGRQSINGHGLVATPGFIDLNSHAYTLDTARYQALDGVTTRLELEIGVFPVKSWYERKSGRELLNYGASVSHERVRYAVQQGATPEDPRISGNTSADLSGDSLYDQLSTNPIDVKSYPHFIPLLESGLREGAIGIGSGTQYSPGITHREMLDVTALAAKHHACVFTHIRYGSLVEPHSTLEALQEQIANAAITGSCVHVIHINSMAMSSAPEMIRLFHRVRARGVDISTDMYPWDSSLDEIRSVMFDAGWEERWGVAVSDLQSTSTGRRLTQAEFNSLRSGDGEDGVLMHMNSEETLVAALRDPLVLIASDSVDIDNRLSHPRSAGTFSHTLGHFVRELGSITLNDAIRKMTLMPAQRLESFVPAMRHKGRLSVGADADLVIFDAGRISAQAHYLDAMRPSIGVRYVFVNGKMIIRRGVVVDNIYPGEPVYAE